MASQFESLVHPLLIMVSVPLAAIGSFWALWLTRTSLGLTSMMGLIMLAGIVVNNAIVLVDYINLLRREGVPPRRGSPEGGNCAAAAHSHDGHHHRPRAVAPGFGLWRGD